MIFRGGGKVTLILFTTIYSTYLGQYMVVQDQAMGLSLSNDTFRQLKDRRRHRRQAGKVRIRK